MPPGKWISRFTAIPADGVVVETKVHDRKGVRNVQALKRVGNLWFVPDGSIYVYYCPTHWRPLAAEDSRA